jgi:hypothetical protein
LDSFGDVAVALRSGERERERERQRERERESEAMAVLGVDGVQMRFMGRME